MNLKKKNYKKQERLLFFEESDSMSMQTLSEKFPMTSFL